MSGQRIGYKRVSTTDQNTARQLEGVQLDEVFEDKASGKDIHRPQLAAMLRHVRKGDIIVVHSIDRFSRSLTDLRKAVEDLTGRGVEVHFLKENLQFTGDKKNPMSVLMLNMLGSFAEFERDLIRERQAEGISLAKASGVYKGRKRALTPERIAELKARLATAKVEGKTQADVAEEFGISRETLRQYVARTSERITQTRPSALNGFPLPLHKNNAPHCTFPH